MVPFESSYISYGGYDGNLARGKQTGLRGPEFNGNYFHIGEIGIGNIAIGGWHQTGKLKASGIYAFGSYELFCGVIGFFQAGANDSKWLPMNRYLGVGLSFMILEKDSFGFGVAASRLNSRQFSRRVEVIFQGYYQKYLYEGFYFESALSYIPQPGAAKNLAPTWAATSRFIAQF